MNFALQMSSIGTMEVGPFDGARRELSELGRD